MVILIALFALVPASSQPAQDVRNLVHLIESRYRSHRTLEAVFLESYMENGKQVRRESGRVYFRRPGKMRWEYESPEKHLFIVDGKVAWFYVPGDHTVTRVPAKHSTDWRTPLALLAGEMKVSRLCARVDLAQGEKAERAEDALLSCAVRGATPTTESSSQEQEDGVLFEVVRSSGELVRVIARQAGGVQVEFRFDNWKMDPPVPDSLFHFEVPPGVAIVNGELEATNSPLK